MYSNIKLVTLINYGKDYVMNQVKHTPLDKALVSASETAMLSSVYTPYMGTQANTFCKTHDSTEHK